MKARKREGDGKAGKEEGGGKTESRGLEIDL